MPPPALLEVALRSASCSHKAQGVTLPVLEVSYHQPAFLHCPQNGFTIFLQLGFFLLIR